MRNKLVLSTAFAVVVALSSASSANAFFGMLGCDSEPSCGCASDCCEPSCGCADAGDDCCEPSCGCADSCCKKKRCGYLAKICARRAAKKSCCCEPSCGCADACGGDGCSEASCGCADASCEPSCGCADSCCKEKRVGCLAKLRAKLDARKCCCEPSCGCADSCDDECCEPSCGCAG